MFFLINNNEERGKGAMIESNVKKNTVEKEKKSDFFILIQKLIK